MKAKKSSQKASSGAQGHLKKIRYALVGLGHIAQAAVLPGFAQAKNSELIALVSGDDQKLEKLKEKYKVKHAYSYNDFESCLTNDEVDAVYIALPNDMHYDCTMRAVDAGKHVLCEKPLALTSQDAERMVRAAERNQVKLMAAYRLHFEPANLAAIELVRSGKLGEPRYFSSTFSYIITDHENIRLKWERGGGPVYDLGVYCINAARYLMEAEPKEVFATLAYSSDPRFREVEEGASVILRFPGGRLASFTVSFGATDSDRLELVGTKGRLVLEPAYEYAETLRHIVTIEGKTQEKDFPRTDQFGGEIEAFSNYILKNKQPEPSGLEGLADVRVIEAIFKSAETGQAVPLPPFKKSQRPNVSQTMQKPPIKEPELINSNASGKH